MQLLTASYGSWRPGAGSPVSISLTTPRWRPEAATWPRLWEATPRWAWFRAEPAEFGRQYLAQLERYGFDRITRRLAQIARDAFAEPSDKLCLICWETSDVERTCHRRLWARWMMEQAGEVVPELDA